MVKRASERERKKTVLYEKTDFQSFDEEARAYHRIYLPHPQLFIFLKIS